MTKIIINYTDTLLVKPARTGFSDTITKQLCKIPVSMNIVLQQYESVEALILTREFTNTLIYFPRENMLLR